MVSLVLLTTEEVLQMNQYWYRLDAAWVTEEMEPFEDVKPEHLFVKPLSRDTYYAKNPDIPRSESEDENSLTLNSFKKKHREWKSRACVKRYDARRRKIYSSTSNLKTVGGYVTINSTSRRVKSLAELNTMERGSVVRNDDKAEKFFQLLLESIPPPPLEKLQDTSEYDTSINNSNDSFLSQDLPDYADFENEKNFQRNVPLTTSTRKRDYGNVASDSSINF